MAAIQSTFLGNRPIVWVAGSAGDPTAPTAIDKDRNETLAAFIEAEIEACRNNVERYGTYSTMERAEKIKHLHALRAVALDPSSKLKIMDDDFDTVLDGSFLFTVQTILSTWVNKPLEMPKLKRERDKESTVAEADGKEEARTPADKSAQKTVPPWYGNDCPLTGVQVVDAAHVVSVQVVRGMRDPIQFWRLLRMFWPLDVIKSLEIVGRETQNIFPLSPTAHRLWDRHKLALRPIAHPTDPSHRMFLQVIWFEDHHADSGVSGTSRGRAGPAVTDLTDIRRLVVNDEGESGARFLAHGDVYELYTADPTTHPLPDIRLFQVRYAVQQLLAGQLAPGALWDVFGGDPPDDVDMDDPDCDEAFMPRDWDDMLREALEHEILDEGTAEVWRKSILARAFEKGGCKGSGGGGH